jgi:glycosyltransferase involved in cell wall biosynthesis
MSRELTSSAARVVIVAARDEADRIGSTLGALRRAFPAARLVVADDGSRDATPTIAAQAGAELTSASGDGRRRGKGGAMTAAAQLVLEGDSPPATVVLCDGDLGASAARLIALAEAVERGECDLAVAAFARREGGGLGVAVGFARWAIRRLTGLEMEAPISGQRALRGELLPTLLPFAPGFRVETAMTIDAVRAGARVKEVELDLEHRATGRTLSGFLHRGHQLVDFGLAFLTRLRVRRQPSRR